MANKQIKDTIAASSAADTDKVLIDNASNQTRYVTLLQIWERFAVKPADLTAGTAADDDQIATVTAGGLARKLTLSQIWTQLAAVARTIAGVWTFSAAPRFSSLTQGSIPFIGASGAVSQDNAGLFYDDTNDRLGVGMASPAYRLQAQTTNTTQIAASVNSTTVAFLGANGTVGSHFTWRAYHDGTNWTSKSTSAAIMACTGSAWRWYLNTGLTADATFTPTEVMQANATGLGVKATPTSALTVAGTGQFTGNTTPTGGAGLELNYDGSACNIIGYDRTGAARKTIYVNGLTVQLQAAGVASLTADGTKLVAAVPVQFPSYTLATLPAVASFTRAQIWVSDMTGGAQYAYSDGTNWRKVSDNTVAA